jgi:hypothetical protein
MVTDMTAMEYDEIVEALKPMVEWNDFAHSLLNQYKRKGDLSERQWDAAERMIQKVKQTAKNKQDMTRDVDVSRIKELLLNAKVKKPVFRAAALAFSLAPTNGKNAGAVYVKRGPTIRARSWAACSCLPHPVRLTPPTTWSQWPATRVVKPSSTAS